MKPSTILSGASALLSPFARFGGGWGIAAGFGSTLLQVGAQLLDHPDEELGAVARVNAAAPVVAVALTRARAEKARLANGGATSS